MSDHTLTTLNRLTDLLEDEQTLNMELVGEIEAYISRRLLSGEISQQSGRAIRQRLMGFARHIGDVALEDVRRTHVEDWLARGIRPASRNAYVSSLHQFWIAMQERGVELMDPTIGLKRVKVPRGQVRALTGDQVAAVFNACLHARDRAMVSLMVQEGLRSGEAAHARWEDLWDDDGPVLDVRGKGGRGDVTRTIPVTDETLEWLAKWQAENGWDTGPMFRSLNPPHGQLAPYTVQRNVSTIMERAGIKRQAWDGRSAHALRHTCAEDLLTSGADVRQVQRILGHSSVQTTEQYLRRKPTGLRDVVNRRRYG